MRESLGPLQSASTQQRKQLSEVKKQVADLQREISKLRKAAPAAIAAPSGEAKSTRRFSAKRLAAQRSKLALSAADFGTLIGVSGQTVYNWEGGKTKPMPQQLEAIAAARTLGKREALRRLEAAAQA